MKTGSRTLLAVETMIIFGAGFMLGFILDHFTTWTGPKPNSWQLVLIVLLASFTIVILASLLIDLREGRDGPEEET